MVRDVEFDSLADRRSRRSCRSARPKRAGQRRLQIEDFPAYLRKAPRDLVLVDAYADGAYADDARALHEELQRRDTGLDVLWSVVDGQAALPEGVRPVARHGRDWYEATGPRALRRRRATTAASPTWPSRGHQRVLQTWHGSPVTAVGLDDEQAGSRLGRGWEDRVRREAAQWDLLVATGAEAGARLHQAFGDHGDGAAGGLPAARPLRRRRPPTSSASAVRERLGIAAGAQVVLYAPTHRPGPGVRPRPLPAGPASGPRRGRAAALGDDHVLLVRPHPKVVDSRARGRRHPVVDVAAWPDVRELLLAADVLVTDYSSLMVDFAHTGRPMVFWTPRRRVLPRAPARVYVDPAELPRPRPSRRPRTMLAAVVRPPGDGPPAYATATAAFRDRYAPAGDGKAAARAVDALLES